VLALGFEFYFEVGLGFEFELEFRLGLGVRLELDSQLRWGMVGMARFRVSYLALVANISSYSYGFG
jgi:hypothetical protein